MFSKCKQQTLNLKQNVNTIFLSYYCTIPHFLFQFLSAVCSKIHDTTYFNYDEKEGNVSLPAL